MIKFLNRKINVHTDTLLSAINKKNNNSTLTIKTLNKLVGIINSQYHFKNQEADYIFTGKTIPNKINTKALSTFMEAIKDISISKHGDFVKKQLNGWQKNADNLYSLQKVTEKIGKPIGSGGRGTVYRDGDFIIKKVKNFNLAEAKHEVMMCNTYKNKTCSTLPEALIINENIKMPFINGNVPNHLETLKGIEDLYSHGLFMADAKPQNFLKVETDQIVPVDFGLVFSGNDLASLDKNIKIEIVRDYIKGGYRNIPSGLKTEYLKHVKALDLMLGKSSPVGNINFKELKRAGLGL